MSEGGFGTLTWAIAHPGALVAGERGRDGRTVLDVPPELSARVRVFATAQGRKAGVTDALWIALVGTRMVGCDQFVDDQHIVPSRAVRTLQSAGE